MWKDLQQLHVLIPRQLIFELDEAAKHEYMSRSEFVRRILIKKINEISSKSTNLLKHASNEDLISFLDVDDG